MLGQIVKYFTIITLLLSIVFPAFASDSSPPLQSTEHTVDMTKILMGPDGKFVPDATGRAPDDKDCAKCVPLTVGAAVALVLNGSYSDEQNIGWQQRFDRSMLAQRIRKDSKAVLDGTEVGVIERLLGKAGMNGDVLRQVVETIDPNARAGKVQ